MKTQIDPTSAQYWKALAAQTRRFGHTYVHAAARAAVMGWKGITIEGIHYTYAGFGRSLESGGHKFKVRAHCGGKPVPSKEL